MKTYQTIGSIFFMSTLAVLCLALSAFFFEAQPFEGIGSYVFSGGYFLVALANGVVVDNTISNA